MGLGTVLAMSLMVGLFEAIFFRGFIQTRLSASFDPVPAVFAAAALYALYHVGYLVLTTILTTIWVCPPKSAQNVKVLLLRKIGRLGTSMEPLPMSGGQEDASSNLASPTRNTPLGVGRVTQGYPFQLAIELPLIDPGRRHVLRRLIRLCGQTFSSYAANRSSDICGSNRWGYMKQTRNRQSDCRSGPTRI